MQPASPHSEREGTDPARWAQAPTPHQGFLHVPDVKPPGSGDPGVRQDSGGLLGGTVPISTGDTLAFEEVALVAAPGPFLSESVSSSALWT